MCDPTVFVVDDDEMIRKAIRHLVDLCARTYESADALLSEYEPDWPGCFVLDFRLPGMCGLVLQDKLTQRGIAFPSSRSAATRTSRRWLGR